MSFPASLKSHLTFLLLEVQTQSHALQNYFISGEPSDLKRVISRSRYVFNHQRRLQSASLRYLSRSQSKARLMTQSLYAIANELEKHSQRSCECVSFIQEYSGYKSLNLHIFEPFIKPINEGLHQLEQVFESLDADQAIQVKQHSESTHTLYEKILKKCSQKLAKKTDKADAFITQILLAHTLRKMALGMGTISDAILSLCMGQEIDLTRYEALQTSLKGWHESDQFDIKTIAETRSGSGVSQVSYPHQGGLKTAIYKDGDTKKIQEEVDGVTLWHNTYPGLAPNIIKFNTFGDMSTLLIEHLAGKTYEHLVLHESQRAILDATKALNKTQQSIWNRTIRKQSVSASFIAQTHKRLHQVTDVHPWMLKPKNKVGNLTSKSLNKLLFDAELMEADYPAPFSVFVHGDFNVDNMLYDRKADRVRYVDVHRSHQFDYVQDITVFMVSNYRMQVFDPRIRKRLTEQAMRMYRFGRKYAKEHKDTTFEIRAGFGLARSFLTSTRFILDPKMARGMYLRARYILERLLEHQKHPETPFKLPVKELFRDAI